MKNINQMKSIKKNLIINNNGKTPAFYLGKNTNFLKSKDINYIRKFSIKNKTDTRICLHSSPKEKIQIMINVLKKKNKYFYNYHPYTDEYYLILSGKLLVSCLKQNKKQKVILQKGKIEFFKLKKNIHHVTIPISKNCVFVEIRKGPFNSKKDAIYTKKFESI